MNEIRIDGSMTLEQYSKGNGKAGVYVWGYYEGSTFIPIYVGKSKNVNERLLQHYCRFSSGEYSVPDISQLKDIYVNGRRIDKDYVVRC